MKLQEKFTYLEKQRSAVLATHFYNCKKISRDSMTPAKTGRPLFLQTIPAAIMHPEVNKFCSKCCGTVTFSLRQAPSREVICEEIKTKSCLSPEGDISEYKSENVFKHQNNNPELRHPDALTIHIRSHTPVSRLQQAVNPDTARAVPQLFKLKIEWINAA